MSLLRERVLLTARTTLHNPGYNRVDPMFHHSPSMVGSVSRPSVGWLFLNDKDGGFTLVHEDHVPQAHMEVLNSRWYREVYPEMYRGDFVAKQYKNLCASVERVMGEGD